MSDFNKQSTEQLLEHLATNTSSSENMEIDINEEFLTNLLGDFKCNGAICGAKCCTNILLLTQKEIDKIRNNIKRKGIEVKSPYSIFNQEYKDRCPFVDEETFKCKIWDFRPAICAHFFCNTYLKTKPSVLNYRKRKPVDMLATFGKKDIFYPCKPNLKEIEEKLKEKRKKAYGGK